MLGLEVIELFMVLVEEVKMLKRTGERSEVDSTTFNLVSKSISRRERVFFAPESEAVLQLCTS